jgi:excisionase family DNA binding protein
MPQSLKTPALLTTGQAARLCSVTPDAVSKWVKSGLLPARRTAGGHYRIRQEDVERLLSRSQRGVFPLHRRAHPASGERPFRYCWEYNGQGKLLEGCRNCAVYMLRAQRCYDVLKLAPHVDHNKLFCQKSCQECDYYKMVCEQATSVLLITDNQQLVESLKAGAAQEQFRMEATDCEYKCSAIVGEFRPDYVVIDCSLGPEVSRDICHHVVEDPRIPYVRVIMAGEDSEFPEGCDKEVFARLEKPFAMMDIAQCIRGVPAVEGSQTSTTQGGDT